MITPILLTFFVTFFGSMMLSRLLLNYYLDRKKLDRIEKDVDEIKRVVEMIEWRVWEMWIYESHSHEHDPEYQEILDEARESQKRFKEELKILRGK